jgi:transcriptional regulator of stress and heat shock response
MARISDLIESFIKEMLEGSEEKILEIQRNELANTFNCAPSQINYVLSTRFSLARGYYIESRRGGGGSIKITRIDINENDYIKDVIWNNIGDKLTHSEGEGYIALFREQGLINDRETKMLRAAINDKTLPLPGSLRDAIRAQLLKTMLIAILD